MQVYASWPVYAKRKAKAGYLRIEATDHGTDGTRVYFLPWSTPPVLLESIKLRQCCILSPRQHRFNPIQDGNTISCCMRVLLRLTVPFGLQRKQLSIQSLKY